MLPQGPLVRRAIADAAAVAKLEPTLKILILQGGARPRRPGQPPAMAAASRYPSVMAVGNGQGQWVLVNMSPAVAHPLDRDPLLNRPPNLADSEPPKVGDSIALAVQDLGTGQGGCLAGGPPAAVVARGAMACDSLTQTTAKPRAIRRFAAAAISATTLVE